MAVPVADLYEHIYKRYHQEPCEDGVAHHAVAVPPVLDGELVGLRKEQPEQETDEDTCGKRDEEVLLPVV